MHVFAIKLMSIAVSSTSLREHSYDLDFLRLILLQHLNLNMNQKYCYQRCNIEVYVICFILNNAYLVLSMYFRSANISWEAKLFVAFHHKYRYKFYPVQLLKLTSHSQCRRMDPPSSLIRSLVSIYLQ